MDIGITLDSRFARHETPPGHPERPGRVQAISERLSGWSRFGEFRIIEPVPATWDSLTAVHSQEHVARIRAADGLSVQLDPDTHMSPHSLEAALLAAGSSLQLTKMISEGELNAGFAIVRPPGHHAESRRAMGFCLFNNIAASAQWAIQSGRFERVAIVDFDVHHGNGTQEIFESRSDVLYISTHQHPLYPGTGQFGEQGREAGRGFTVNFPIPPRNGNAFYDALFDDFIVPILRRFKPELLLVSAGYDGHADDPLAGMNLDEAGFFRLSNRLNGVARDVCSGRVLYVLEGGYDLQALAASVQETLSSMLGDFAEEPVSGEASYREYRPHARKALQEHWGTALP